MKNNEEKNRLFTETSCKNKRQWKSPENLQNCFLNYSAKRNVKNVKILLGWCVLKAKSEERKGTFGP